MRFKGLQQSFVGDQKMTSMTFIRQGGIGIVSRKSRGGLGLEISWVLTKHWLLSKDEGFFNFQILWFLECYKQGIKQILIFLSAKLGSNPSYIWRSILWGRQVLNKGIRWHIGNGKNVLIYKDNRLPRANTFKPIYPRTLPKDTAVADLMNAENQWDIDKLNQHFMNEDIEMIFKREEKWVSISTQRKICRSL